MEVLSLVISALITAYALLKTGDIIFEKKRTLLKVGTYFSTIGLTIALMIVNIVNNSLISNTLRIIVLFTVFIGYYKIMYNNKISTTIMASFIIYLLYFLAEVIVDIPLYIILSIFEIPSEAARNLVIINLAIGATVVGLANLNKDKLKKMIVKSDVDRRILIIISLLILITLSLLIFSTPVSELRFDANFIVTMLLLVLFSLIGFILIKQKIETQKITDKYIKLAGYSQNNEGLLEEYRVNLHETKNQLIIIDNMIPKKYKEVHEYIEGLIEKSKSGKYYWLTELKYVPLPELKGFINFKVMEMINQKLDLEINISREINKNVFKNYKPKDKEDLYSIIGVFLDNAKEASKASKEKAVSVQMYMENKNIKLLIANTYKGKIDLDKISEYGYSSKGTNRGTGLHIVEGIINGSPLFEKETTILDNYFVQTLTIKPKQKKKKS